jgi:ribonuclease-3
MFRWLTNRRLGKPSNPSISNYIFKHFGFRTKNVHFYEQALRHSSSVQKGANPEEGSNERLEFLGDAVLDIIVADYLYRAFPSLSEGELTKMKSKVVSRRMLNGIGDRLEIRENLTAKLGKQPIHTSMVGNALEALIGAIYLDKGFSFTFETVLKLLQQNGIDKKVHDVTDFKSKLHEWSQKTRKTLSFIVESETPETGNARYVIAALINGDVVGRGKGKSKKVAEQLAAREACKEIFRNEE